MLTNEDKREVAQIVAEAVKEAIGSVRDAISEGMKAPGEKVAKEQIMAIKDPVVRREMIRRHPEAFNPENWSEEDQIKHEMMNHDKTDPVFESMFEKQSARIGEIVTPEAKKKAILAIRDKDGGAQMRRRLIEAFPDAFESCVSSNPWERKKLVKRRKDKAITDARKCIEGITDPDELKDAIMSIKDRGARLKMIEENPAAFLRHEEEAPETIEGNGILYERIAEGGIGNEE